MPNHLSKQTKLLKFIIMCNQFQLISSKHNKILIKIININIDNQIIQKI